MIGIQPTGRRIKTNTIVIFKWSMHSIPVACGAVRNLSVLLSLYTAGRNCWKCLSLQLITCYSFPKESVFLSGFLVTNPVSFAPVSFCKVTGVGAAAHHLPGLPHRSNSPQRQGETLWCFIFPWQLSSLIMEMEFLPYSSSMGEKKKISRKKKNVKISVVGRLTSKGIIY